ncbi:MAG: hydantoinase/oxoprolinase N-terminal domain-containing protein [Spirochaetaceae bacterium]
MTYRLGIDVGGTNTDAVILDEHENVHGTCKTATTEDVSSGINRAVETVLGDISIPPSRITNAMLGTTHATNAIVERKGLARVAVLRLAAPSGHAIPPFLDWPQDLLGSTAYAAHVLRGGYEYNGALISALDTDEIRTSLEALQSSGAEALAISCAFSPVNDEQERRVQELAAECLGPDFPVTLSSEIGSVGLIERENAAILNAAIRSLAEQAYGSFEHVLQAHGISADLFITQNDGTLMSLDYAKRYPVLTIASGPTNSLRGAAHLSGVHDGIVVDVGGTTTDVGVLKNGFPRESTASVEMGGVRTNFRMPDLIALGLGGGSVVEFLEEGVKVGPSSVGYRIHSHARVFGGDTLTATDVAVAAGRIELGDPSRVRDIDAHTVSAATGVMRAMIEETLDRMKNSSKDVPVVVVGGGSALAPDDLRGAAEVLKPEHYEVANAIGAAIAQVSGGVDGVFDVASKGRERVLEEIKEAARTEAVRAGAAADTVDIVEVDEIPLAYLPSNAVRFRVKAAGSLRKEA